MTGMVKNPSRSVAAPIAVPSNITLAPGKGSPEFASTTIPDILPVESA